MMISQFFQLGPIPENTLTGFFDFHLVLLSYIVASSASYIALDLTGRLRDLNNTPLSNTLWLIGGSFAMGAGIWSMHFIGMLAFHMHSNMNYDLFWTVLSIVAAVLASAFAFFLLKVKNLDIIYFALGGVILGLGISTMHYLGMQAMTADVNIRYLPKIFLLSIVIGITASELALWFAIRSNPNISISTNVNLILKSIAALIMGAGICGMHYTGMAAAVFTPLAGTAHQINQINPTILSVLIANVTFVIMGVAFGLSTYKKSLNQQLMIARRAGMGEVAANVLHNVGNVLNSVNVSTTIISQTIAKFNFKDITEIIQLINHHKEDINTFLTSDQKGSQLITYLEKLTEHWQGEQVVIIKEIASLVNNVQHIKDVISAQLALSGASGLIQEASIENILGEVLIITNINYQRHDIELVKKYQRLNTAYIDKVKLVQILVNLVRNARDSLVEFSSAHKVLTIEIGPCNDDYFFIQVTDNGVGIPQETMKKIFRHGFTTKKLGHGFGLHASAIAVKEMGGTIKITSEGLGKGASFRLEFPYKKKSVKHKV